VAELQTEEATAGLQNAESLEQSLSLKMKPIRITANIVLDLNGYIKMITSNSFFPIN
jgi:hypothetical protein